MTDRIALDTNILVYLHDVSAPDKRLIAKNLLSENPFISTQVISEYLNTTRRLLALSKEELLFQCAGLLAHCDIEPVLPSTLTLAATLVAIHKFQLFDSVILAAAIENKCSILYSEDMQHGFMVEKTLTIINPFI
jgi:predicted nucleic acid-binding protein